MHGKEVKVRLNKLLDMTLRHTVSDLSRLAPVENALCVIEWWAFTNKRQGHNRELHRCGIVLWNVSRYIAT